MKNTLYQMANTPRQASCVTQRRLSVLFLLLMLFYGLSQSSSAQNPTWQWAKSAGSTGWDFAGLDNGNTISTDANSNSYVTGLFNGTATFGTFTITSTVTPDIFVAKYDISGNCLWVKNAGGDDPDIYGDQGQGIDIDALGNCYVTGTFHGSVGSNVAFSSTVNLTGTGFREIFIAKYNSLGVVQWAKQPSNSGNHNNYAKGIAVDNLGNSYITGYLGGGTNTFGGTTPLSGPGAYAVKYDPNGIALWATKIGNGNANGMCIDVDLSGNCYVSGYMQGTETFSTTPTTTLTSIGMRDVFLARVTSTGTLDWVKQFGGANSFAYGRGISIDAQGNIFVTGDFDRTLILGTNTLLVSYPLINGEAFIAKLDNNGTVLWAKQSIATGTSGNTRSYAVKVKGNGECFITGNYNGAITFCSSLSLPGNQGQTFVIKFDASGNCEWAEYSGPTSGGDPYPHGISLDGVGSIYIAGNFQAPTAFGGTTITSFGGFDVYVAKLAQQDTCVSPPQGMVSWWPLDETSGTTVADIVGGFNGTAQLGPIGPATGSGPTTTLPGSFPPGMVGSSLFFGAGRYIRVPNNPGLDPGNGDFTIDAWFIWGGGTGPIVQKMLGNVGYRFNIYMDTPQGGGLSFEAGGSPSGGFALNHFPITRNQWHHVAGTIQRGSPDVIRLYLDGQLVVNITAPAFPSGATIGTNADLLIGGDGQTPGARIAVDEVELFNRALTQQEIQSIWAADSLGKCKPVPPQSDCPKNIIQNWSFINGAVSGAMPSPGQSSNWTRAYGTPDVALVGGCSDSAYVGMWGNQVVGEALQQTLATPLINGGTYSISFCARWSPEPGRPYPVQFAFRASNVPLTSPTGGVLIGVSQPIMSQQNWVTVTLPNWTNTTGTFSILTISATNQSSFNHGDSTSYGHIDRVCIRRDTTTGVVEHSDVPTGFALLQSYPNPFNPTTTIEYHVPVTGFVKLSVFDILGREIAILVNENKSVGKHRVTFDASSLPSGIYFYRMQAGEFQQTRKLVLLK